MGCFWTKTVLTPWAAMSKNCWVPPDRCMCLDELLKPICVANPPSPCTACNVNTFPVARRESAPPSIIPGKLIWWKCKTRNWSDRNCHTRYLLTCSPTSWANMPELWPWRVNRARPCAMRCAICWKTNRHNTVLWSCRPIRENNFTNDMCNGYWTSKTFTTIPPKGNPKRPWLNSCNRTLKELTYKYMTTHNTLK